MLQWGVDSSVGYNTDLQSTGHEFKSGLVPPGLLSLEIDEYSLGCHQTQCLMSMVVSEKNRMVYSGVGA
ncbi:RT_RNaseH_2 domain-containing protein [Caenorhabditis elegans]|uniref:RT_RNaseH_2 domain-containing protein n=1 Tax=Caenorhabditis elegans TaxID=6239 RepID=Q93557_CAEEL|nr:RT_RNaseH_2 domain-containing protein [Caenorhabditis elegans]CAB02978.1 RT_RNaseH_2 domain-containing protein [Caenorhabditis elegans]|eukprot:NP_510641.1 Uncharacterized protein CELE_F23A7.4 [Caenorhabditis elegans]